MPNAPHPATVTVSFTLPRELAAAVESRARVKLTNKSDIIRRALLDYLGPEEACRIMESVLNDEAGASAPAKQGPVEYPVKKRTNRKKE